MSYKGKGMGAYYNIPGPDGLGCTSCSGLHGVGLGGIDLNAAEVWSAIYNCNAVYQASKDDQGNGTWPPGCIEPYNRIRAAFGELGYGVLKQGVPWYAPDQAAWKKFAAQHSLSASGGLPTEAGLQLMEQLLKKGATPGGETPVVYSKVGNEYAVVGKKEGAKSAGMGTAGWLILGAVALGGVALIAKKRGSRKPGVSAALTR